MPYPDGTGSNYIIPSRDISVSLPPSITHTDIPTQHLTIRLSRTHPRPKSSRYTPSIPAPYTPRFKLHKITHPLPSTLFPHPFPLPHPTSSATHPPLKPQPTIHPHPLLILINLITHHHHPKIKRRPHQQERPPRLPALTDIILHQPRQRLDALSPALLAPDIKRTIAVHVALGTPELDADDDQPDQPEDEQDEGAENYDAGEEGAGVDEVQ